MGMKVNGSTGLIFPDNSTMTTGAQAVKAWVNFNGTGTVAIRAAFNVTSITDNGAGDYTVNFTNAMPDANYALAGLVGGNNGGPVTVYDFTQASPRTTTSFRVCLITLAGGLADAPNVNVAVFD